MLFNSKLRGVAMSNTRKYFPLIFIIIWIIIINIFSSMDYFNTNKISKKITKEVVMTFYNPMDEKELNHIVHDTNLYIRKFAHAFLFFILSLFVLCFFNPVNKALLFKQYISTLLICFSLACFDELHQYFVPGRSSSFVDTLIDLLGSIIGCLIVNLCFSHNSFKNI